MDQFITGNPDTVEILNKMQEMLRSHQILSGGEFLIVSQTPMGTVIKLDEEHLQSSMPRILGTDGIGINRRAKVTEDAPAGAVIVATLYNAATGVLETSGDEFEVDVYCNISNPSTGLDDASRRLEENDEIIITKMIWDNSGTPTERWYLDSFQGSRNSVCPEP